MTRRRLSAKKKGVASDIARERVITLLQLAKKMLGQGRDDVAKRYCSLARKIQLRYRVRLPRKGRLEYCKKCFIPWVPGKSVRVRLDSNRRCVEYACVCGHKKRIVY
ncbi:MAG: ribonuclease P [Candidatus Micrarchaeia archaeon]